MQYWESLIETQSMCSVLFVKVNAFIFGCYHVMIGFQLLNWYLGYLNEF